MGARRFLTSRWKALRATARARRRAWRVAAGNRAAASHCFYCGGGFEAEGKRQRTVDHRLPRSRGGSDRLSNLVFACLACNQRKADRTEEVFVASEWLAQRRAAVAAELAAALPAGAPDQTPARAERDVGAAAPGPHMADEQP